MSTSSANTNSSRRRLVRYKKGDPVVGMEVLTVLKKFNISEQLMLQRHCNLMPQVIMSAWQENYKLLDLHEIQQQLVGNALLQFLHKMRLHFSSVRFRSEKLQEELNILDRSRITELPGVRDCEIRWDNKGGDSSVASQWPLHALPKLLCCLSSLEVHMPIHVDFIEHFGQLKDLTLHEKLSRESLAAIWSGCKSLERVQLLGRDTPNTIGISQCQQLCELTLPVASFNASSAFEILQLPKLQLLDLQRNDESAASAIDAISLVFRQRALDIHKFRINGQRLGSVTLLPLLELQRCHHLTSLSLIDCLLNDVDISTLGVMPQLESATFKQCSDLKDEQVLAFAKACPQLTSLHLLSCKQLTTKLLYSLCEWRCKLKPAGPALELCLGDSESLKQEFRQHVSSVCRPDPRQLISNCLLLLQFPLQSTLQLLNAPPEDSGLQHVQFFFLHTRCQ
ncbi:hypothetical protein KR222_007298 [Zaprionus bogoriensis]|nr:hypothetical protein KR222_007298 [Zaprionus bogoriensis]